MKTQKLLITFLLLLSFSSIAQINYAYQKYIDEAMKQYRNKKYDASTDAFVEAFNISKNNYIDLYNGACSASLAHRYQLAFKWLESAIDEGYINASHLQKDIDFLPLRTQAKWGEIVAKVKQKKAENKHHFISDNEKNAWLFKGDIANIYDKASDSLHQKMTKKTFRKTLLQIRNFLKYYHIENMSDLKKITHGISSNSRYTNRIKTETEARNLVPDTINGLPGAFVQDTGYKLSIAYLIQNGHHQLNEVTFTNPFFDKKYFDNVAFLKESISKAEIIHLYTYYNENKYNLKKDEFQKSIAKTLLSVKQLPYVKAEKVAFNSTDIPLYNIILSNIKTGKTMTIIFSDTNENILVSDGHKMGFVRDKKAKVRQVLKELY